MSGAGSVLRAQWPSRVQRMLVIDSDEAVVTSIRQLMASHPCNIDWAKDDSEALEMIEEVHSSRRYDVIIADFREALKGDSALLPLIRMRGHPLPMILTCQLGYDPSLSIVKARSMGLQVFLYKPFRADHFYNAISRIIRDRRS